MTTLHRAHIAHQRRLQIASLLLRSLLRRPSTAARWTATGVLLRALPTRKSCAVYG